MVFIRSTDFQDNRFQHISIYSRTPVDINGNNFHGYGGGILTDKESVHFANNTFGPYTTPPDTGDVYLTVYKKTADTIHSQIKWGADTSKLYATSIGSAKGVVVLFHHHGYGNDWPIHVESDGNIKHVFQPIGKISYPEWSDTTNFRREKW
jgi:hypothetical protein